MLLQELMGAAQKRPEADGRPSIAGLENISFWKMFLEAILQGLESCSEQTTPEQMEDYVRNYDNHDVFVARCHVFVKQEMKATYGRLWRREWRRKGKDAVQDMLAAANNSPVGTIAAIARNPFAEEV